MFRVDRPWLRVTDETGEALSRNPASAPHGPSASMGSDPEDKATMAARFQTASDGSGSGSRESILPGMKPVSNLAPQNPGRQWPAPGKAHCVSPAHTSTASSAAHQFVNRPFACLVVGNQLGDHRIIMRTDPSPSSTADFDPHIVRKAEMVEPPGRGRELLDGILGRASLRPHASLSALPVASAAPRPTPHEAAIHPILAGYLLGPDVRPAACVHFHEPDAVARRPAEASAMNSSSLPRHNAARAAFTARIADRFTGLLVHAWRRRFLNHFWWRRCANNPAEQDGSDCTWRIAENLHFIDMAGPLDIFSISTRSSPNDEAASRRQWQAFRRSRRTR